MSDVTVAEEAQITYPGAMPPGRTRRVDAYGVGSSLIRGQNDFTADVVLLDGRPAAKAGRRYSPNPRLELVE